MLSFPLVVVTEFLISFRRAVSLLLTQLNSIGLVNYIFLGPHRFCLPLVRTTRYATLILE